MRRPITTILAFCLILSGGIIILRQVQKAARPDIILITIDALRSDHLGCYGYPRNTSPNIDALARDGAVFLNCFSVSSGTVYSLPSFFTGRYLSVDKGYVFLDHVLGRQFTTLAEYLRQAGYETAAVLCNANLRKGKGFKQGFDSYFCIDDASRVNETALDVMAGRSRDKPLFLWVHYLDPHAPYNSLPEGCLAGFIGDRLYEKEDRLLKTNPANINNPYTSKGYIPKIAFQEGHYNLNYYVACYDCEIRHSDSYVGELLKKAKKNTLIIISSDHGEGLGAHGYYFAHEESIYDGLLHIPLIIKDNRSLKGGKRVATIASSVDLVPTVLARIRPVWYLFNRRKFDGIDLSGCLAGKEPKRRFIYSYFPWSYSIRDVKNNYKYILNDDGKEELYFLPDEDTNHIDDGLPDSMGIKEELKREFNDWRKSYPVKADSGTTKSALDQKTKNLLRSLGYMQ